MNEFNIIQYLNDINLKDIIAFIKLPNEIENVISKYLFQAKNENEEIITGYIYILNNEIHISYKTDNNFFQLFSSKIIFYTSNDYEVITKHSIINYDNKEIILEKKIGKNIDKKNIFNFKENKNINTKILVKN